MAQKERLDQIKQILRLEKRIIVADLSDKFGVTPETIRRDLEKLEGDGLVVRTYGGAVLNQTEPAERIDFLERSKTHVAEKRAIALLIPEHIQRGSCMGCDASSTVMEALKCLGDRDDILVLTNSVKVIREMEQSKFRILSTGGLVNRQSYSMQGGVARSTLQEYNLDLVLISCKGMSSDGCIFDSHELEVDVKKTLIERGEKVILLIDHSKFGRVAFAKLADLEQLDMIVTDRRPSEEWMELFARNDVRVIYPEMK